MTTADGSAVLVTENCQLDKRSNSGRPKQGLRLQFVPLEDLDLFGHDRVTRLRNGEINPPEAFYVGEFEGARLAGRLSELFSIPADYFGSTVQDFSKHAGADPEDPHHLVVDASFDRIFTMDPEWITVLYSKIFLFWTRQAPKANAN